MKIVFPINAKINKNSSIELINLTEKYNVKVIVFTYNLSFSLDYISYVKDTVCLDKTLDELRDHWKQYFNFK